MILYSRYACSTSESNCRAARCAKIYSRAALATYTRAIVRGQKLAHPEEDTRQLGGDAMLRDGILVALWRPRSPDDRPPAAEVTEAASAVQTEDG